MKQKSPFWPLKTIRISKRVNFVTLRDHSTHCSVTSDLSFKSLIGSYTNTEQVKVVLKSPINNVIHIRHRIHVGVVPSIMSHSEVWLSKHQSIETSKYWDIKVSRHQRIEAAKCRNIRVLRHQSIQTSKYRGIKVSKHQSTKTLKYRNIKVLKHQSIETSK